MPRARDASSSLASRQVVPALIRDGLTRAAQSLPQAMPGPSQLPPGGGPIAAQPPTQVIATAAANQSLSNVEASPAPMVNPQPTLPVSDRLPPAHAAPARAAANLSPPANRPAVVLDNDELIRLMKRGEDLLSKRGFRRGAPAV